MPYEIFLNNESRNIRSRSKTEISSRNEFSDEQRCCCTSQHSFLIQSNTKSTGILVTTEVTPNDIKICFFLDYFIFHKITPWRWPTELIVPVCSSFECSGVVAKETSGDDRRSVFLRLSNHTSVFEKYTPWSNTSSELFFIETVI